MTVNICNRKVGSKQHLAIPFGMQGIAVVIGMAHGVIKGVPPALKRLYRYKKSLLSHLVRNTVP